MTFRQKLLIISSNWIIAQANDFDETQCNARDFTFNENERENCNYIQHEVVVRNDLWMRTSHWFTLLNTIIFELLLVLKQRYSWYILPILLLILLYIRFLCCCIIETSNKKLKLKLKLKTKEISIINIFFTLHLHN